MLAVETIPSLAEVEALAAELDGLGVPAWVSVTPDGDRMRTGEPLLEAFRLAAAVPEVVAVGVNCCEPSDVDLALAIAAAADLGVPVIAYPNTGEGWDAAARAWTGEPTLDAERAQAWTRRRSASPRRLLPRRTRAPVAPAAAVKPSADRISSA